MFGRAAKELRHLHTFNCTEANDNYLKILQSLIAGKSIDTNFAKETQTMVN
jgi:hypothetical protein